MGLRAGYKQTEVGPVPVEWQLATLGDISVVGAGGTPSRENASYWNGAIPWVTTSQIHFDDISDAEQFITEAGLRSSAAKILPPGTLLMALYGQGKTRGKVAFLAVSAATNQACASITLSSAVAPAFIKQFLAYRYEAIRSASNGGSQDNLNGQIVKKLPVILPSLPEQRAIAAALSDVDALIGSLDRLIAKKRDLKQAAMQQLLTGQTRLPGFKGEWATSTVGHEFDIQLGKMLDAEKNRGVFKPYVGNKAVQWNRIDVDDLPLVAMSREDLERYRLRKGDLLVCEGGEVGRAAIWDDPIAECYYQKALHRLRPRRGFNSSLMVALLRYWADHDVLANYVTQTSIAHLTREKFADVPMPVPCRPEQHAIATVLADMDAELSALGQRRDKTRLLMQGMMQELLTGRTRLI